jgi:signal transduction histidine kinase
VVAPAAPTLLSSIHTAAGEVRGADPIWEVGGIEIPYGEWVRLEFIVLDFGPPDRHRYSYRLGSTDAPWIELGSRRGVTFTDLKPGTHRFMVRGRNDAGQWTEAAVPLAIRVIPPFWMTLWFRLSVFAAIVATALAAHRIRTAALQRRNLELLALQRQRETVQEALTRAYGRLRLLTRRLEAAREDERQHIARELHDELGPALTAVAINLQLLTQGADAPKHARRLADSTELVDRMAQQIRDLSLKLRPPLLDEMGLVAALKAYLEAEAERTGLSIDVRGDAAVEGLAPEIEISAFRMVQEAVTNVVRHARARRVIVSVERGEGCLELAVQDDGAGFDAASALDGAATGKALGLLGMQERVQILGGTFELRSQPGEGTRVRAALPLGEGR